MSRVLKDIDFKNKLCSDYSKQLKKNPTLTLQEYSKTHGKKYTTVVKWAD